MTNRRDAILDVAERLIRAHGYSGFSFRDVASEVGIKSASVHYHFPTKPDLAAEVAKRYRQRFFEAVEAEVQSGAGRVEAWRSLFRRALDQDGLMCLCGILATEGDGLPTEVANEARAFLRLGIDSLNQTQNGEGGRILSQLEGAMLIARSTNDVGFFDIATENLA